MAWTKFECVECMRRNTLKQIQKIEDWLRKLYPPIEMCPDDCKKEKCDDEIS